MSTEEKQQQGIYFLSLSVENVRCFGEKQTLDLSDGNGKPAKWTVILGNNGTGKTTLLNALAECLVFKSRGPVPNLSRIGKNSWKINLKFGYDYRLEDKVKTPFSIGLELQPGGFDKEICSIYGDFNLYHFMLFGYNANRTLKKDSQLFNIIDIQNNEPFNDQNELINAEEWLLQTDYVANKPSQVQVYYQERLTIVKEILVYILPDVKRVRISEPTEKLPNPRVEFETDDGWLQLDQLSLGYQTMTAWMVDLAARMFAAYPNSPNPIAEPAVVLIDEIDLHLHPKWQRTIMSYLSERFINTQFIVTAHSPLIVQAAEQANIVVLKRQGDSVTIHQQEKDVQGWRIDQLLTSDLFDLGSARSPFYENKLAQRRQILSKPELTDEDQAQLKVLEAEIGDLPTAETAEDIAAMNIIRRAAELLKTSS